MANLTFKTGAKEKFPSTKTPGQLSFITDGATGSIYLDIDANNRVKFNADAKKLETAVKINDTDFDGSSNIRTNSWGWNREFKIGNYTLDVDGSQEKYEWSLKNIGISKKYASFATPSSNSWGWYTIATIADNSTSPAIFFVRAYAHSSMIFTVSKGYSTTGSLNVLDYNASANQDYAAVTGARLMSDGRVQIYLRTKKTSDPTQNAMVDVEINAINSSDTLTIANTLVADDTANPSVIITRNCTVTGNIIGNLQGSASSLRDKTNGTETYLNYGAEGISSTSWFAAWNGYELRGISPVNSRITMSALSATNANGYYGMGAPDGDVTNWIRTTQNGIIPYVKGGSSSLGTESWPFSYVYTNNLISYGPIKVGNNANGDTNYITFYGTTGDGPGSYNHTAIGENLYGGSEGSELVLFKGNDVDNSSGGTPGPDRIRHIAACHLFQTYDSALSGSWTTICDSTVPVTKLEIKPSLISSMVDISITGWVRTIGSTGWRNETYGGGWYMSDDTWIRAYNNKPVYVSNTSTAALYTAGGVKALKGFTNEENGVTTTINSYNSSWTHYQTNSPSGHWFNKSVSVAGNIYAGSTYSDLVLTTANYSGYLDSRYLKLAGGNMNGTAVISWPDTGNWSNSNSGVTFPVVRGGLQWTGQSDWIKLFAEETASDLLNLVCHFGDDANPALVFRNKDGTQVAKIGADGIITATTFSGSLSGNASSATYLGADTSFVLNRNSLQYFNINGTAGNAFKTNDTPTSAWWHIMRCTHANSAGYYTDLAIPFNDVSLYYKRIANGTVQNGGWIKVLDTNNYTGTLDSRYLKLAGGTMTGHLYATSGLTWYNATWQPVGNITCTPTANNQEWSIDVGNANYTGSYFHIWSGKNQASILQCFVDDNRVVIPSGTLTTSNMIYANGGITGSLTGNASSASKWATARTITHAGDLRGSYNLDGSGNVTDTAYLPYVTCARNNSNTTYSYHRIMHCSATTSWVDNSAILIIHQGNVGGGFGIAKVSFRTNDITQQAGGIDIQWLARYGINANCIQAGYYWAANTAYADVYYYHTGSYTGAHIRILQNARMGIGSNWTLVSSVATGSGASGTNTTNTEVYTGVNARTYTTTVTSGSEGIIYSSTQPTAPHVGALWLQPI